MIFLGESEEKPVRSGRNKVMLSMERTYQLWSRHETPVDQWLSVQGVRPRVIAVIPGDCAIVVIVKLVKAASFNDGNAQGFVGRQSGCECEPGCASANDDIVERRVGTRRTEVGAQKRSSLSVRSEEIDRRDP